MVIHSMKNKGFTLLEVLVAIAIAAVIMAGAYKVFTSLILIRNEFEGKKDKMERIAKMVLLMQADIRGKTGNFMLRKDEEGVTYLEFTTTHSLFFGGAVPVRVSYFLKQEENGRRYLYRKERDAASGIDLCIPLTHLVQAIDYKFYLHNQWQDTPTNIIQVCFKISPKTYCFAQRGIIE